MAEFRSESQSRKQSDAAARAGQQVGTDQRTKTGADVAHPKKDVATHPLAHLAQGTPVVSDTGLVESYFVQPADAVAPPDVSPITNVLGNLPVQGATTAPAGKATTAERVAAPAAGLSPDVEMTTEAPPGEQIGFVPESKADADALDAIFGSRAPAAAPVTENVEAPAVETPAAPVEDVTVEPQAGRPVRPAPRTSPATEQPAELPPIEEEFPEIANAGTKSGTRFVQFEQIGELELVEQIAWAIRWLVYFNDREAKNAERLLGLGYEKQFGERGGLLERIDAAIQEQNDNAALYLIRAGLHLHAPQGDTKEASTKAGLRDLARGLSLIQGQLGITRAVQAFRAMEDIPVIEQVKQRLLSGLVEMPRFVDLVAALGEDTTTAPETEPTFEELSGLPEGESVTFDFNDPDFQEAYRRAQEIHGSESVPGWLLTRELLKIQNEKAEAPAQVDPAVAFSDYQSELYNEQVLDQEPAEEPVEGLEQTGFVSPEGELVDTTTLLIQPDTSEAEADVDFARQVAEERYEASQNETAAEEAAEATTEAAGGDGGQVPPGGTRGGGGFDEGPGPEGEGDPRSEIRKRIEKMIAAIQDRLDVGVFPLKGDDRKTGEHSFEVNEAIERTLEFFNIETEDPETRRAAEKFLFRAFQIYRGVGVDANGRIFGKKAEDAEVFDETFIDFLEEIRENTRAHGHPFAYMNRNKKLGDTYVFPVISDRETAEFFTQGDIKWLDGMTADQFIDYTVKQWYADIEPLLTTKATPAQREALWAMFDAIAERSDHPDAIPRSPDARASMSEMLRADSLYAQMFNSEENLAEATAEREQRQARAEERKERHRKKTGENKEDPLTPGRAIDDPAGLFERMVEPNVNGALRIVANIGRTMGVIFMPMIGATGVVEGGTGAVVQSWGTKLLKMLQRHTWNPTGRTKEIARSDKFVKGIGEVLDIISWKGMDGALDAASHGVRFTKGEGGEAEVVMGQQPLVEKASKATEGLVGAAMSWSTGDWAWNRARAQVFIENLIYQLERSSRNGGLTITPEQVEAAMEGNLDDFIRQVIEMPEGRAALLHAVNTSLGGIDPLTETLRRATRNQLVDTALGFTVGWYLKFGIRSPLRMIPFSNTAIFAIKRGIINPAMVHSGLRDEAWVRDSNESMFGANDEFAEGFFQNVIIDLARFGTQAATYTFVFTLISLLGGLEPPDDEDKDHLWYEYKIQGRAFKENWYWLEILGFAMPFAVAMHVGGSTGDMGKVKEILLDNGIWEKLGDSPWDNVTDYVDLINNFDQKLIEAQSVSAGYKEQVPVSKDEFIFTQFMTLLGRRGYQTFEPAIVRALYNERGLGRGINDLARSPNVVYTPEPDDGDATEMTTWQDAQKRRMAMPSPGMGKLLNLISGFNAENPEIQETGYLRKEMPLIANVDPTNMMWITELSVLNEDGSFKEASQWTDEEIRVRVQTVLDLLDKKTPSELAANGVVIPYDARGYTMAELNRQWKEARVEHDARMENGDFNYKKLGIEFEEARKLQNDSWAEVDAKREAINKLKEALFSDEIPYSALKYNRWETNYRTLYRWKEGTPKAGQPATALDYRLHGSKIDVEWYPSGDHKSGFLPWLSVDDRGQNTYDAQTPVGWQTDQTDMEFVRSTTEGKTIPQGMFEGQDLWGTLSGGGAVGPGAVVDGSWDEGKLLFGARAYQTERQVDKKLDRNDFKVSDDDKKTGTSTDTSGGFRTWRRSGWSSGGGYAPKVYSNPAYNLNADKPAGLFRRSPQQPRYDFLRPSVQTKGSREAYRREDI